MEWPPERICELIEMYKENKLLWDPKDPSYRLSNKRQEVWDKIGQNLGTNTIVVQRKMNSLLASYRRERKFKQNHSKWYAFEKFHFLDPIYKAKPCADNGELGEDEEDGSLDEMVAKDNVRKQAKLTNSKSLRRSADAECKVELRRKKDDLDLYGEYIASEIRKLNVRTQLNVKHLINNILFEAQMSACDDPEVSDQMIVMTSHHV